MNGLGPFDCVLAISSVPWDYLAIAPQQTMRVVGRHHPVVFLDRQLSVGAAAVEPRRFLAHLRDLFRAPRQVAPGVVALTPPPAAPWTARSWVANRISMAALGWFARRALRRLGYHRPLIWSFLPQAGLLAGSLGEVGFVYDVIDEYSAFPNMDPATCEALEASALDAADLVLAISPNLVETRRELHPQVHWLPVGAETERFARASDEARAPPLPEVADLPRPWIGYYGSIDSRLDVDLCVQLAGTAPDLGFLYFGPVRDSEAVRPLRTFPNVRLPGPVPYEQLPDVAARFDVCSLPYRLTRFNRFIFPNKIFEYLATGNPVVSTPIPSIEYLAKAGHLALEERAEGYLAALRAALAEPVERRATRIECARENTWTRRGERALELVSNHGSG